MHCWNLQHWFGDHWLKVNMPCYSDLCRHGPVILSYIWKPIWHMNIIYPDYEMVWHNDSPQYCMTYMSWFSDFYLHDPVILSYIWKPIWHMNIISPNYEMVWHNDSLQYERSQHNLHVMVQWFLPSWFSDFVLYLKAHLTNEHRDSVWRRFGEKFRLKLLGFALNGHKREVKVAFDFVGVTFDFDLFAVSRFTDCLPHDKTPILRRDWSPKAA